jgi:hypothetical protein
VLPEAPGPGTCADANGLPGHRRSSIAAVSCPYNLDRTTPDALRPEPADRPQGRRASSEPATERAFVFHGHDHQGVCGLRPASTHRHRPVRRAPEEVELGQHSRSATSTEARPSTSPTTNSPLSAPSTTPAADDHDQPLVAEMDFCLPRQLLASFLSRLRRRREPGVESRRPAATLTPVRRRR